MATYKVPQDVEADDKLIGPFSFRQFIYLIIVALAGALAWGLAQLFIGLAIIPLPVIIFFGVLALPLRKDQPMEIYLAAIISFYLKPRKRLWDADGIESLIEITVPKTVEVSRTKDITQADAEERFSYLADIVDSQGWAIRGQGGGMNADALLEAQSAEDVLDTNNSIAQSFNTMMTQTAQKQKAEAIERMRQPAPAPAAPQPATPAQPPLNTTVNPFMPQPEAQGAPADQAAPSYNPYPTFQQTVVQPVNDPSHVYTAPVEPKVEDPTPQTPPTTSDNTPSADIMNLANNSDLSVETIAREAQRIHTKESDDGEVVISLR